VKGETAGTQLRLLLCLICVVWIATEYLGRVVIVDIGVESLRGNLIEGVFKEPPRVCEVSCREDRWKGGLRRQVDESEITFFKLQARILQWGLIDSEEGLLAGS